MEFRDAVRKRRMVRSFTGEPVPPDAVERMIDIARRAPSAGYSQGVEFVVVTDAAMLQAIGSRGKGPSAPSARPTFVAQAPVQIVICVSAEIYKSRYREPDKMPVRSTLSDDELWAVPYWHTDAGCALMLILLAAVDEGLAAGLIGVMGTPAQARLRELLAIPEDYVAIGVVALGHPAPDAAQPTGSPKTRKRRPLSSVLHRERW